MTGTIDPGNLGNGKLMVSYIVTKGEQASVDKKTSELKAVPIVISSVQRCETVILDGEYSGIYVERPKKCGCHGEQFTQREGREERRQIVGRS